MQDNIKHLHHIKANVHQGAPDPVIATVCDVTNDGLVLDMGCGTTTMARMTAEVARTPQAELVGAEVLVLFDGGNQQRPIAVARMHSTTEPVSLAGDDGRKEDPLHAIIDGERVILQAEERIELRCGKGSITITRDGKITLRGTHLLSRSSGPLRIKGGHVDIN